MDGAARHQIHLRSQNIFQSVAQGREAEQGESTRTVEIDDQINIGIATRLIPRNRAKHIEPPDAGVAKLRFVRPQGGNDLISLHV